MKIKDRYSFTFLKIVAFLLPVYFVYFGFLYEKPGSQNVKSLWKFVFLGFLMYFLAGLVFILKES